VVSVPASVTSSSSLSPVIVTVPPAEAPSMTVSSVITISPRSSRISASFSKASPAPEAKVMVLASAFELANSIASRSDVWPSNGLSTSAAVVTTRLGTSTTATVVCRLGMAVLAFGAASDPLSTTSVIVTTRLPSVGVVAALL
jgi:hypothetical protein